MASFQEYKRRGFLPMIGVVLAFYFLLVYLHLCRTASDLDVPLQKSWVKLATALGNTNALALDFVYVTNQLQETRQALAAISSARQNLIKQMELPPPLRDRVHAPFELFEYQNKLSQQLDSLDVRAKQKKVAIDPAVFAGFPEHSFTVQDPALLWAALAFTESLLDTALDARVLSIHSLFVVVGTTNVTNADVGRWVEIPLELELSASANSAARFVESLPLRQLAAAEPPPGANTSTNSPVPVSTPKVPLLIDSFIIRKQAPETPDTVRLWVRVVGFVHRS